MIKIGLYRGKHWIARAIQWFMKIYRNMLMLPKAPVYNHAFLVYELGGILWVVETTFYGVKRRPLFEAYPSFDRIIFGELIDPVTPMEKVHMVKILDRYVRERTRYDFMNFIYQILMIFTGKWYGKTGTKAVARLNCAELVVTALNELRPGTFPEAHQMNPEDIRLSDKIKFEVYADSK